MGNSALNPNNAYDPIVGVLVSILTGWLSTCNMPPAVKQVIALVLSIAIAAGRCYLTGDLTGLKVSVAVVVVLGSAYASYKTITKDIAQNLQAAGPIKDPGSAVKLEPINITDGELK